MYSMTFNFIYIMLKVDKDITQKLIEFCPLLSRGLLAGTLLMLRLVLMEKRFLLIIVESMHT